MIPFESEFENTAFLESESRKLRQSRWQLNQDAFDGLLAQLSTDRKTAGEKYLLLRKNLVRFFETRKIFGAEEATDEVLDRLAKKIQSGEIIDKLTNYASGIARLVALENYKKPAFEELPVDLKASQPFFLPFPGDSEEKESRLNCLEKCLNELSDENRQIVIAYYEGDGSDKIENRKKLGAKLGIPQNALCKRIIRLREKLESCVSKCA
ncbi:MAG: sigma-70 family RNA polymerase sigma factor [Pyrinomonadaceae bacterium]|nr:sigma-70 family RNA polymerase sigma factor [Pyrinomonadaceae bacterium]